MSLGVPELIILFLIVVLFFGASRLPQLGQGLGRGLSNFKKGIRDTDKLPPASDESGDADES